MPASKYSSGFGQFVPGFDFLQRLVTGAGGAAASPLSNWIAPTLSVQEVDKRIQELKAVAFWLDQNATALKATIQALEVQKMTLSALKSMNVGMNELAHGFQRHVATLGNPPDAPEPAQADAQDGQAVALGQEATAPTAAASDALPWWVALSQQFQHIASRAVQDVAQATQTAPAAAQTAPAAAASPEQSGPPQPPPEKASPKKTTLKKTTRGQPASARKTASAKKTKPEKTKPAPAPVPAPSRAAAPKRSH